MAAILVVHDGEEWLGSALATIAAQRYPALDLVVVDNASHDLGTELLGRHIHADRLLTLPRNVGFGRAVASALKHPTVERADYLLLLHDDLVLAPDAIAEMVEAIESDPTLGIVGPKLREWSEDYVLQEVGMTTDRFGRAESQLEPGELDQGQHDRQRDVLYVSTAGMLLRRDVLRTLGGFDARFPAFRDDLDLCWRAWLAGMRVEVVPEAVGYHIAASSRIPRAPLASKSGQARYYAERHTIAALLKNYSALRLLWILPIMLTLAFGKTLAFVATRRFADAAAVVKAYFWNLRQLPHTLRRRRFVQRRRVVSDAELAPLFAPGLPRLRAYAEAIGTWAAGADTRALIDDRDGAAADGFVPADTAEDPLAARPALRMLRDHPAACTGLLLFACYLIGLAPLLGAGQVVGGEIAPWPATARAFLRAYASSWNGEPLASAGFPSPAQAILGILSFAGFGSAWLAQRLLVFGLLPLAWMLALRAGRLVTTLKAPRALGATIYVLNPVVLGALAQGRYGVLVTAALLPGLVLVAVRAADRATAPGSAWRAAALLALGLATVAAFSPPLGLLLGVALAALTIVVLTRGARHAALRLAVAFWGAVGLLAPWLLDVARLGGLVAGAGPLDAGPGLPLWRAVTMVPEVVPGLTGPLGLLAAAAAVAVVVAALGVALRIRPRPVAGLVAVPAFSAVVAWAMARWDVAVVWSPALLLPGALALAVLGVVATRWLVPALRAYDFGARQLSTAVAAGVVLVGILGGLVQLVIGPWDGLRRDPDLVPAFVAADVAAVGPYRVLLLADRGGAVAWSVTNATGPSMADFGTLQSVRLTRELDAVVGRAAGGADPSAGAALGLTNVRYVVIATPSEALTRALGHQPALEPLPSSGGSVYRVRTWLPRAVVLPPGRAEALLASGDPGPSDDLNAGGLPRVGIARYRGQAEGGGLLVVSEAQDRAWRATANGELLEPAELAPVNAFPLPQGEVDVEVETSGGGHRVVVAGQIVLALAVMSLALRPPGFTQRKADRSGTRSLPAEFTAAPEKAVQ